MKYAIQGWLSDDYVSEHIFIDANDVCSRLLESVDELSKYTHINEDTLYPKGDIVDDTSIAVLEDIQHLFHSIRDAKDRIMALVCDSIDETMVETFYMSVLEDIDMLASNYEIEHFTIQELCQENVDDIEIKMIANGFVHVRLQYGSNGDMRRGDGWIQYIDLPFSSTFNASYKNKEGDVHIVDYNIEVDNDPYYDVDKVIDEYIDGKASPSDDEEA